MASRMLLGLLILAVLIVASPILTILAFNFMLETAIPLTAQSWVLVWVASFIAAVPLIAFLFIIGRLTR